MSKSAREVLEALESSIIQPESIDYFEIKNLAQKQTYTHEDLFDVDDFVVPPIHNNSRDWVKVKMGYLFYEFCPGGKQSFVLKIKYIHLSDRSIRELFSYTGKRYPLLQFEDLVPISLFSYYHGTLCIGRSFSSPEKIRLKLAANQIRNLLIKMSCGEAIQTSIFREHSSAFFAALAALTPKVLTHEIIHLDVKDFGKKYHLKPRTIEELSAKIAVSYFSILGVYEQEISKIFDEFFQQTHLNPLDFNETMFQNLISAPIDQRSYTLSTIVSTDTLKKIITDKKNRPMNFSLWAAFFNMLQSFFEKIREIFVRCSSWRFFQDANKFTPNNQSETLNNLS